MGLICLDSVKQQVLHFEAFLLHLVLNFIREFELLFVDMLLEPEILLLYVLLLADDVFVTVIGNQLELVSFLHETFEDFLRVRRQV